MDVVLTYAFELTNVFTNSQEMVGTHLIVTLIKLVYNHSR